MTSGSTLIIGGGFTIVAVILGVVVLIRFNRKKQPPTQEKQLWELLSKHHLAAFVRCGRRLAKGTQTWVKDEYTVSQMLGPETEEIEVKIQGELEEYTIPFCCLPVETQRKIFTDVSSGLEMMAMQRQEERDRRFQEILEIVPAEARGTEESQVHEGKGETCQEK